LPFAKINAKAPRPRRIWSLGSFSDKVKHPLLAIAHGQSVAAFCSSATKHFSAVFRCHSGSKTMSVFALSLVWLVRPFHPGSVFLILVCKCTESPFDIQAKPHRKAIHIGHLRLILTI
jgi:hypothetical protein